MLDTMCLSAGGWHGLICRGHWGCSIASLMLLRWFVFLNFVDWAPEAAGIASHLEEGLYLLFAISYVSQKLVRDFKNIPRMLLL